MNPSLPSPNIPISPPEPVVPVTPVRPAPPESAKYDAQSIYPGSNPSLSTPVVPGIPAFNTGKDTTDAGYAPVPWGVIVIASVFMSSFVYYGLLIAAALLLSVTLLSTEMIVWFVISLFMFILGASMIRRSESARIFTVGVLGLGVLYMVYAFIKTASASFQNSISPLAVGSYGSIGTRGYILLTLYALALVVSIIYLNLPRVKYWFNS